MGLFKSIKSMVTTEDPYGDNYGIEEEVVEETAETAQVNPASRPAQDDSIVELKVVRPETFASVTEIADHLLNHCTVVLNLEATNREAAKRLIDFLAGVAYSINGQLKNVANNTYIITPCNVDVADAQIGNIGSADDQGTETPAAPAVTLTSDTLF
ncbi:MAG: cell division protein SepF [Clostridia bacterium]|nr:cell division protein SepF [Clostridia bacterium]